MTAYKKIKISILYNLQMMEQILINNNQTNNNHNSSNNRNRNSLTNPVVQTIKLPAGLVNLSINSSYPSLNSTWIARSQWFKMAIWDLSRINNHLWMLIMDIIYSFRYRGIIRAKQWAPTKGALEETHDMRVLPLIPS